MLFFLLSGALVLYVLIGYPCLLALLARRRSKPVLKRPDQRTVSIILPVRNGEPWLRRKLESILALNYPRHLVQVLVLSDGSEDRTEPVALEFARHGVEVLSLARGGKAAALNEGIRRATGEILFFTDVRQELDPESLANLVACFADPSVGAVSGELVIRDGKTQAEASTGLYWRYEKWIRTRLSRLDSVLGATGCIYAMRRELAAPIPADTILDDVDLPLRAIFRGYRVILEPSARAYDYPTSLRTEFRRKVRTLAGVYQTTRRNAWLLSRANRLRLHFISHKLGRLVLPWALLVVVGSSFALPQPWRAAALAAQATFYGFALADAGIPEGWVLKRLTSPVRTFVVLMAAALCAVSILFVPSTALWKETRAGVRSAAGSV